MERLNIGCGKSYWNGYKNIDISTAVKTDECYNIENGINEKDGSIEEIFAGCVLEQVEDLAFVMNECHRVLRKGGTLRGYVPSTDPRVMFLDPMDKRFFQEDSFRYFVEGDNHFEDFGKNYGFMGWEKAETEMAESGILHFNLTK
jgi:predicted SAM-dependent methyltransferase